MKEAAYYTSLSENRVQCQLCPNTCTIADGKHGICLTRRNQDGRLLTDNYCRPVSTAIDPIEKKPLYHFYPGSSIFSSGPNGCTLKCNFCQNYEISQKILFTREISANELISMILKSHTKGIAYTYTEPYIWYETIMKIGPKIKDQGMVNVMVTNGYMNPEPLNDLLTVVDAMNIDIKSMSEEFYRRLCKGELAPVLKTCETVKKHCHLEITNLLITGENDSEEDIKKLVEYIANYLGKDTPLHISRYFPRYKLRAHTTPENSLFHAWEIANSELDYVYLGNIISDDTSDTFCPSCHTLLVERSGYSVKISGDLVKESQGGCKCNGCGSSINIIL